jgi:maleylpyruvate isomerase
VTPVLYDYFRSSAAFRVRIALNLKGLAADRRYIHLRKGEQRAAAFRAVNPSGLVPAWQEGRFVLTQSLAIIEYLEETHPEPPLLPGTARDRAAIREMALAIACDIHPVGNLRVLDKLTEVYGADERARAAWARHWIEQGLPLIEARLAASPGRYCFGDTPTLADVCLAPQLFNARRFAVDLTAYPLVAKVDAALSDLAAFRDAAPQNQPDAE